MTVYQNLYYNAKLCLDNHTEEQLNTKVANLLHQLGLYEIKNFKVGSPLNPVISGGQRKRLNIGLELIREPSVLFIDEPTSGLSSRDSENIMDLLKELTYKGKLIFVVIHQPSSEIFKLFDKISILDIGGYPVYYGNPVEAIMYFKERANQINSDVGQCPTCGNVHPEQIFDIIEAKVVDEYGRLTDKRKITPEKWHQYFKEHKTIPDIPIIDDPPPYSLYLPNKLKQFWLFLSRDVLSKLSNTQYMVINLLEAPVLAFVLAYIITYVDNPGGEYIFYQNKNIPAYLFMCVIVALFMGLTISAEEIFRDRKIRERESFLNLSYMSYLLSKVGLLFGLSAIQMLLFVLIGNWVIGIQEMQFEYWFALFTTACFANMLGLNISSAFNSAVTIYILIPILLIPQMILSGAIFQFDNLNRSIGSKVEVPVVADFMTSRWTYEALAVKQFKNNSFKSLFYKTDKQRSQAKFKQVYLIPTLLEKVQDLQQMGTMTDSLRQVAQDHLAVLNNELHYLQNVTPDNSRYRFNQFDQLTVSAFNKKVSAQTRTYLNNLKQYYTRRFNKLNRQKQQKVNQFTSTPEKAQLFKTLKQDYHNKRLATIVKNVNKKERYIEYNHHIVQKVDPIYNDPLPQHSWDYQTHFYAPQKHFLGNYFSTYWFNINVVWGMSIVLYVALYFNILRKIVNGFSSSFLKSRSLTT